MKVRRGLALCLALALVLSLGTFALAADAPWYASGAEFVAGKGLAADVPGGYEASRPVSRGAVLSALRRLSGGEAAAARAPFLDVPTGSWYAPGVDWAYAQGILRGTGDSRCDPLGTVDRAQLATMLTRWLDLRGIRAPGGSLVGFADEEAVPAWARTAMGACAAWQLVRGDDLGRLDPGGTVTWAQLGTVLERAWALAQGELTARVTAVDKYGRGVLSVETPALASLGFAPGDLLSVSWNGRTQTLPYADGVFQVDGGVAMVLAGEPVTLAVNMGSFAGRYGIKEGDSVTLSVETPRGWAAEYALRNVGTAFSLDRMDYESDAVFANFRMVELGDIAGGALFRSASPIDPAQGRRSEADALLKQFGVKTVVNLADCRFRYMDYPGFEDTHYATRRIVSLNMGADFRSAAFCEDVYNGLEFITEEPGPYLLHGGLGVERTGFVLMVLEALMGATKEELLADYMVSYENVYHVERGSEAWVNLERGCALYCLLTLTGAADETQLEGMDLAQAAEDYLTGPVGLKKDQVDLLKAHLAGNW